MRIFFCGGAQREFESECYDFERLCCICSLSISIHVYEVVQFLCLCCLEVPVYVYRALDHEEK